MLVCPAQVPGTINRGSVAPNWEKLVLGVCVCERFLYTYIFIYVFNILIYLYIKCILYAYI